MRTAHLVLVAGILLGCGSYPIKYSLTKSTTDATPPKPRTCSFRVINLPPRGAYEEIATLVSQAPHHATNPVDFENSVRDQVCRIGGDIVVTEINGYGWYMRGTVLRAIHASESKSSTLDPDLATY